MLSSPSINTGFPSEVGRGPLLCTCITDSQTQNFSRTYDQFEAPVGAKEQRYWNKATTPGLLQKRPFTFKRLKIVKMFRIKTANRGTLEG